ALFSEREYGNAPGQYVRAFEKATELLDLHAQAYLDAGIPVGPLDVIACHSVASTHREMGKLEEADAYFHEPVQVIKTITQDPDTRDSIRYKALREVTRVMVPYLDFCGRTGRKGRFDEGMAERLGLSFKQVSPN